MHITMVETTKSCIEITVIPTPLYQCTELYNCVCSQLLDCALIQCKHSEQQFNCCLTPVQNLQQTTALSQVESPILSGQKNHDYHTCHCLCNCCDVASIQIKKFPGPFSCGLGMRLVVSQGSVQCAHTFIHRLRGLSVMHASTDNYG